MSDSSIVNYSVPRIGRDALDLLRHVLTATLGTAFAESEISGVYHAKTLAGAVTKEVIVSGIVASLLGALLQHFRPSNLTRWIWLLGIATLAFTVRIKHDPCWTEVEPPLRSTLHWACAIPTQSQCGSFRSGW